MIRYIVYGEGQIYSNENGGLLNSYDAKVLATKLAKRGLKVSTFREEQRFEPSDPNVVDAR